MIHTSHRRPPPRRLAWALALSLAAPVTLGLAGCGNNSGGSGGSGGGTASAPAAAPMSAPAADPSAQTAPAAGGTMTAAGAPAPAKPGMSNGKKALIVLAGAALVYYLYKKHQAAQQAQAGAQGGAAGAQGQQLYRSQNGGVYYRNAQHQAVWLTAPAQAEVPASDVQQYAPDYQQYQGQPAPAPPAGAATAPFASLLRGL